MGKQVPSLFVVTCCLPVLDPHLISLSLVPTSIISGTWQSFFLIYVYIIRGQIEKTIKMKMIPLLQLSSCFCSSYDKTSWSQTSLPSPTFPISCLLLWGKLFPLPFSKMGFSFCTSLWFLLRYSFSIQTVSLLCLGGGVLLLSCIPFLIFFPFYFSCSPQILALSLLFFLITCRNIIAFCFTLPHACSWVCLIWIGSQG